MDGEADGGAHRTPLWVKVFGIIGAVLALLLLAVLVFGGGEHGPGRHAAPSGSDETTPPNESSNHTMARSHHTAALNMATPMRHERSAWESKLQ